MKKWLHIVFAVLLFSCSKEQSVTVSSVTNVTTGNSSCALVQGAVQCWGPNVYGQLGNGHIIDSLRPTKVVGLTGTITHLSAGFSHMCAVADDVPYCWGYNAYGSTGTGDTGTDHATPTRVLGTYTNIKQIDSQSNNTCLLSDEGVSCWGGSIGDGHNTVGTPRLVTLPGLPTAISRGTYHACVIIDGGVWCWGKNDVGQLGNNSTVDSVTAVQVSGLSSGVVGLATMQGASCALLQNGSVQCWGDNTYGQLGNNSNTESNVPVEVARLTSGVTAIKGAAWHMMAIQDGQLFAWGRNGSGQLGNGTSTDSSVPLAVPGLPSSPIALSPGAYFSCALVSEGVRCWGSNGGGNLGNGKLLISSQTPVEVGPWE